MQLSLIICHKYAGNVSCESFIHLAYFLETVRGAILNTLGVIAERFPEHLTGKADRMSSIYLGTLKEQVI